MTKKLLKIGTGLATAVSTFYWGVLPAMAVAEVNICPTILGGNKSLCEAPLGLGGIISSALNVLLFVAFIVALVFLILGGIKWILSGGDKEGSGKAKETITAALIGLAVVLGSWILINVILGFFGLNFANFLEKTPKLVTPAT